MRGRWFLVVDVDGDYGIVDGNTGRVLSAGRFDRIFTDVAISEDGTVYGVTWDALYEAEPATGATRFVADLPSNSVNGLDADPLIATDGYGRFFMIDPRYGTFYWDDLPGDGTSAGDIVGVWPGPRERTIYFMAASDATIRVYDTDLTPDGSSIAPSYEIDRLDHGVAGVFGLEEGRDGDLVAFAANRIYHIDPNSGDVERTIRIEDTRFTAIWGAADAEDILHLLGLDDEPSQSVRTEWDLEFWRGPWVVASERGSIYAPDDHDWIRVQLDGWWWYRIDVQGSHSGAGTLPDPGFVLRDARGRELYVSVEEAGNPDSFLLFKPPYSGTFYIDVSSSDGGVGTYTVRAEETSAPADSPDIVGAYWLPERQALVEQSEVRGDYDVFAFRTAAGERFTVRLTPERDPAVLAGAPARLTTKTDAGARYLLAEATAGPDGVIVLSGTAPDDGWIGVDVRTSAPGTYRVERLPGAFTPPLARDDHERVSPADLRKGAVAIRVLDNDEPGSGKIDKNSLTVTDGPDHGEIVGIRKGAVLYRPDAGFSGADTFTYTIADKNGLRSAPASVTVEVEPVQPPDARDDLFTITPGKPGKPVKLDVLSNDGPGTFGIDRKSLTIVDPPDHGTVRVKGKTILYVPEPGYSGEDTMVYEISAIKMPDLSDTATVHVEIHSSSGKINALADRTSPAFTDGPSTPAHGPSGLLLETPELVDNGGLLRSLMYDDQLVPDASAMV